MYNLYNFIIYSILGYLFEILVNILFNNSLSSGFLYGPYTPIYGICIILMFSLFNKFSYSKPNIKKYFYMFLSSFIIITTLELTGGILLKKILNTTMWSYEGIPLTIGKYINVFVSLFWSISIILIYKYVKPKIDKFIKKIPLWVIYIISLIMMIDLILTLLNHFLLK